MIFGMGHHHHAEPTQFNVAFIIAIILNLGFVIIEALYAYNANSTSLLADAGHNLADVLGLIMAWAAMLLLSKKATDKYSYGFKRTTILAAIANTFFLIITTVIIFYESISKILHPQHIHEIQVMVIAAIGIMVNGGTALLFTKGQDDLNIKAAFLHLAYDALVSIGVVITGAIILWTGWYRLDPIVGLIIAIFILYGAWGVMRDSVNLILDAVPITVNREAVETFLVNYSGITEVHHVHIWGLSTKETALTAHVVAPAGFSDDGLHDIHRQLAEQFNIHHATIQVEQGGKESGCCV